ncbi:linker for activation of T-cells family member 1 isoform X2 [Archocentrus centrarchus]|uniref:linker for activation of T-cells family member 1 isoform X2 n=1 Tax=Archocentrus centrarchus TaxID=63155 RepID=UPI0011E9DBFE|nr:uncharacterized protein LOC115785096 isoform X2 [Archocentrus centrarchus]
MDVSWFLLLVSAAIFISIVLLVVICLDCRNKGPLRSIQQTDSEEYMQPGFRVIHPSSHSLSSDWPASRGLPSVSISAAQPTLPPNPVIVTLSPDPHLRSPLSNSTKPQHRPYTPTETESNPSYENPAPDIEVDDERDDPGYIEVLPDDESPKEPKGIPAEIQSRASTPSSDHNYENVEAKKSNDEDDDDDDEEEESSNYENVQPHHRSGSFTHPVPSFQRSTQSSDEEYEDNYVNQSMGLVNNL